MCPLEQRAQQTVRSATCKQQKPPSIINHLTTRSYYTTPNKQVPKTSKQTPMQMQLQGRVEETD